MSSSRLDKAGKDLFQISRLSFLHKLGGGEKGAEGEEEGAQESPEAQEEEKGGGGGGRDDGA